jgi:hypothetical protein
LKTPETKRAYLGPGRALFDMVHHDWENRQLRGNQSNQKPARQRLARAALELVYALENFIKIEETE